MKTVLGLNLGLAAPAPNTRHPAYGGTSPAHHCGREPRQLVLATNTFENLFEFRGASRLLLLGAYSKPRRDLPPSQAEPSTKMSRLASRRVIPCPRITCGCP